ncbi:hypothetical protein L6452_28393 [Arctium lappa]|uniref:Uncharacterized protein n=1 Tax=Arctium lappa TaxID=4217 RepID=A0ACB8ZZ35_ARCLA|nr:hypothetical protein L6452_28393 [Arctium lappa]
MAVLLHPDKNKTVGADEAFKLLSEAWAVLSDSVKRSSYDAKQNKHFSATVYGTSGVPGSESSSNAHSSVNRLDTFWTVCTSCRVQYEYLRKYVNKRLSCKNCRGVFVAVETGAAPVTYAPWSYSSENGYANHPYNEPTYVPSSSVCISGNGSAAIHSAHGYEYTGTVSFQWNTLDPNGLPSKSVNISRAKANGKHQTRLNTGSAETPPAPRIGRPPKKRKIEAADAPRNTNGETGLRTEPDLVVTNADIPTRHYPIPPVCDARKLLIDKARSVIRGKLMEMKLGSTLKGEKNGKTPNKSSSMTITVPDPDFHDFDMDRSEEVFKPKQIWAIYDEEDGMPRLYCIIRQVISVKPFQVHISYLNSKTDTESGSTKIESGFTKSCGSEGLNLPDGCWDLDPAATPEELLQAAMEVEADEEEKKKGEVRGVEGSWNWKGSEDDPVDDGAQRFGF